MGRVASCVLFLNGVRSCVLIRVGQRCVPDTAIQVFDGEFMRLTDVVKKFGTEEFILEVDSQLRRLAQESPDFRYGWLVTPTDGGATRGCVGQYAGPGQHADGTQGGPDCAGCIFGQALQRMGWSDTKEMAMTEGIDDLIVELCDARDEVYNPLTWALVQEAQDRGVPWGEAILHLDDPRYC